MLCDVRQGFGEALEHEIASAELTHAQIGHELSIARANRDEESDRHAIEHP